VLLAPRGYAHNGRNILGASQLDFGQNLNGLAIDQGAKHGVHQFLYGHGQAETARKIAVVSAYPANALSPALSKLAKVELSGAQKNAAAPFSVSNWLTRIYRSSDVLDT
jgi:hypothetical protein